MNNFRQRVFELTGKDEAHSMLEYNLVNRIVLPLIVRPYFNRNYISDDFVCLMADYGEEILVSHPTYYGELLMELAMQRISCGGIIHGPYNQSRDFNKFSLYFSYSDEMQPLSPACWSFIEKQAVNIIKTVGGNHMEQILWAIIDNINLEDKSKSHLELKDLDESIIVAKIYDILQDAFTFEYIYNKFATFDGVVRHKQWFRKNWESIDEADLLSKLNMADTSELKKLIFD
ncbi:MAG: hypothetical protein E7012_04830 [Alphaproteobacteria bacterium]|nr:hypothetical protein [Alphaproteobacteria bacterium]